MRKMIWDWFQFLDNWILEHIRVQSIMYEFMKENEMYGFEKNGGDKGNVLQESS